MSSVLKILTRFILLSDHSGIESHFPLCSPPQIGVSYTPNKTKKHQPVKHSTKFNTDRSRIRKNLCRVLVQFPKISPPDLPACGVGKDTLLPAFGAVGKQKQGILRYPLEGYPVSIRRFRPDLPPTVLPVIQGVVSPGSTSFPVVRGEKPTALISREAPKSRPIQDSLSAAS